MFIIVQVEVGYGSMCLSSQVHRRLRLGGFGFEASMGKKFIRPLS
jgi:hypothetical protein